MKRLNEDKVLFSFATFRGVKQFYDLLFIENFQHFFKFYRFVFRYYFKHC